MSIALLYVIVREELDSDNMFPSLLHPYTGGLCWLNIAIQFKVMDELDEDVRRLSSRSSTKRKGTWTENETQVKDGSIQ